MNPVMLPEMSLEDVDIRLNQLKERINEAGKRVSEAEIAISAAKSEISVSTHELSYWTSLGRILLAEKLDQCRDLVLDSISSKVPVEQALDGIHGLSRAIFFLQMNAISNRYGLAESASEIVRELSAMVPSWFSTSGASSDAVSAESRP